MPKRLQLANPVLLCLAVVLASGCQCETQTPPPKGEPLDRQPNLVFVSFDALQASHVGCLGASRKVTPAIDSMASSGFNFTNAISVSSWTVPSSMTWFTGVYPSEHRMTNKFAVYNSRQQKLSNLKELAPSLMTLAEILRENGYRTGGFTGNAGVSAGFGFEQGFDVYVHEKGVFGSMGTSIPKALEWLKAHRKDKFFLFLHGYDVHGQASPRGGYDYRFVEKDYDGKYIGSALEQEALREEGLERGRLTMRDRDVRFWRAIYDEKVQRTDAMFQHFLDEFGRLGLADNTIFVLTSDHGTELYEHRRFDHGFSLYQELVHVPLIIKLPGQTEGKRIADRVGSIDLLPTILELLEARVPETARVQLRGKSLVPAIRGERIQRDCFSETDYREYTFKRSIISQDGWKLIVTLENQNRELFDLKADPEETRNLAKEQPERTKELERRLFEHFRSIGHDLAARRWEPGLNPVYGSQGKLPAKK